MRLMMIVNKTRSISYNYFVVSQIALLLLNFFRTVWMVQNKNN